jgi:hypothetical protein
MRSAPLREELPIETHHEENRLDAMDDSILLVEEREEDEVSDRRAALGDVIGDTIGQGHDDNATNDRPDDGIGDVIGGRENHVG